jgi:uncharacterized protein (DUF1330 family)
MPAYIVGIVEELLDAEAMGHYIERIAPLIAEHHGHYVFVSDTVQVIEGDLQPAMLAAVEFADMDRLRAFWACLDQTDVKALRQRGSRGGVLFVDAPNAA